MRGGRAIWAFVGGLGGRGSGDARWDGLHCYLKGGLRWSERKQSIFGYCLQVRLHSMCGSAEWWVVRCTSVPRSLLRSRRGALVALCHLEISTTMVENSSISRAVVRLGYIMCGFSIALQDAHCRILARPLRYR